MKTENPMKKVIVSIFCLTISYLQAIPRFDAKQGITIFKNMYEVYAYELENAKKLFEQKDYVMAFSAFADLAKLSDYVEIRQEAKKYMALMIDKGLYSYEKTCQIAFYWDNQFQEADRLRDAGQWEEAIAIYREISQLPTWIHGLNTLANCRLAEMGEPLI